MSKANGERSWFNYYLILLTLNIEITAYLVQKIIYVTSQFKNKTLQKNAKSFNNNYHFITFLSNIV